MKMKTVSSSSWAALWWFPGWSYLSPFVEWCVHLGDLNISRQSRLLWSFVVLLCYPVKLLNVLTWLSQPRSNKRDIWIFPWGLHSRDSGLLLCCRFMYQHFSTMPYVYTVMLFCLKLFTTFDIHAIRGHVQYMLLSYKLFTASRQSEVIDLGPRVIGDHLGGFHGLLRESNARCRCSSSRLPEDHPPLNQERSPELGDPSP